jgi:hypothetical protein
VHPKAFSKGKIGTHKPKKKLCHYCTLLLEYKCLDETCRDISEAFLDIYNFEVL